MTKNVEILDAIIGLSKEGFASKSGDILPRRQKEMEMWRNWNTQGRKPNDLRPLLTSFKPLIEFQARRYKGKVEIPTAAIDAEYQKQFLNAMKTYDPNRGAQLHSWVSTNLQKASRYIKTYQNLGKIPEARQNKITEYKQAKIELYDKFGFEPDTKSLSDYLKWPQKHVEVLQSELRKDLPTSGFGDSEMDPYEVLSSPELEAIRLIQYDLSPEERIVYEYTFGMNGKKAISPGEISRKTNIHPSRVSRIRAKIRKMAIEAAALE